MAKHSNTWTESEKRNGRTYHRGACECGWRSVWQNTQSAASSEATYHNVGRTGSN